MFRHGLQKIAIAFEAVAVICQYKIEAEEPLYDVLIDDIFKEYDDEDSSIDTENMQYNDNGYDSEDKSEYDKDDYDDKEYEKEVKL